MTYDAATFAAEFDVPRGTFQKLEAYASLLVEWQARMNLVGPATLPDLWNRHFRDSAQLLALAPPGKRWLDVGSGGGFPGLVVAAMSDARVTLVDSIAKKCQFLLAVRDALALSDVVTVANARVESLPPLGVDVVTARACAALDTLLGWGLRHATPDATWLLLKGERWMEEVETARGTFRFDLEVVESRSDPRGRVLVIRNVARRAAEAKPIRRARGGSRR